MIAFYMTDCSDLFEVAYKWILAPPKRDVRALCANQSVPGSTKQRKIKKKTKPLPDDATSIPPQTDSQMNQALGTPAVEQTNPAPPFLPIPPPYQHPISLPPAWTARNPALAQYHQLISQQNPKSASSDDAFKSIMQRIQATPIRPNPQPQAEQRLSLEPRGPNVILPPPQFNMGQPPPTLLAAPRKEVSLAPLRSMYPPSFAHVSQSHSDISAGILFVHSDLGRNPQWRDQFASQFYRSPSSLKEIYPRPQLPRLSPRPLAPSQSRTLMPLTRPEYLPPNLQNSNGNM